MTDYDLGRVVAEDGRGIVSIEKTSTSGLVDTYTITYSDGTTSTFEVRNGEDGSGTVVDSELSTSSENPVQNKVITTALNGKASTTHNHDSRYYTETETDTKLEGKADSIHTHSIGDVTNLQTSLDGKANSTHTHSSADITESSALSNIGTSANATQSTINSAIDTAINGKANSNHTHTESDITDLGDYIEKSSTSGLMKNDGTIDTTTYLSSLPSHNHDDRYYTESEVNTALSGKAPTSHASTESTYGLGTATIHGHVKIINKLSTSAYAAGEALSAYQGRALRDMIYDKQDKLVSGTNIKTVNNTSLLGSGDISIPTIPIVTAWSATVSDSNVPSEKLVNDTFDAIGTLIGNAINYINQ